MIFSRISFKLVLIVGISLLGMIALAPIALSTLRAQMVSDRQAKTQHMVDVGYGILAHYQKLESEGKLTHEQAQAAAIAQIKSLRYDKVEYFWLNDMAAKMIMHPIKPELDGKDLSDMKDPTGNRLFSGFVDVVSKQGCRLLQLPLAEARLRAAGRQDLLREGLCALGLAHRHRHLSGRRRRRVPPGRDDLRDGVPRGIGARTRLLLRDRPQRYPAARQNHCAHRAPRRQR